MIWAYGITTVPQRHGLFCNTRDSLRESGFDEPLVRVDHDLIGAWGNWWLLLNELWIRNPQAELFAIFQDDVLAVQNLREYVEQTCWKCGPRSYWNLYTAPSNQEVIDRREAGKGWFLSNQLGKGACALVFDRETMPVVLGSSTLINKPRQARWPKSRVDGALQNALSPLGYAEWCHNPSLVQHVANAAGESLTRPDLERLSAPSFPGEDFDARSLLGTWQSGVSDLLRELERTGVAKEGD